jgi:hypothetical protein
VACQEAGQPLWCPKVAQETNLSEVGVFSQEAGQLL